MTLTTTTELVRKYPEKETTQLVIRGLFDVYNEMGFGFRELQYQRALAVRFKELGLVVEKEKHHIIYFHDTIVGRYFIDFLINGKVVVELKVGNAVYESHIRQVVSYMKITGLEVGLIAVYAPDGVKLKRIAV